MNTDALLIVAGMIFVVGMLGLIGIVAWNRHDERIARRGNRTLR